MPPLFDAEGFTWYYSGTNKPFDMNQPIYEELEIELRREKV